MGIAPSLVSVTSIVRLEVAGWISIIALVILWGLEKATVAERKVKNAQKAAVGQRMILDVTV